jgi:hypothetical protein
VIAAVWQHVRVKNSLSPNVFICLFTINLMGNDSSFPGGGKETEA